MISIAKIFSAFIRGTGLSKRLSTIVVDTKIVNKESFIPHRQQLVSKYDNLSPSAYFCYKREAKKRP